MTIDHRIPLQAQSFDMLGMLGRGSELAQFYTKQKTDNEMDRIYREAGGDLGKMAELGKQSKYAHLVMPNIKSQVAAQEKLKYDRLKTEAEISKIGSETLGNNDKVAQSRLSAMQKAIGHAAMTGDKNAAIYAAKAAQSAGAITPEQYTESIGILNSMDSVEKIKQYATSVQQMLSQDPAKFNSTTADNRLDNETSRANNEATVGATLKGQQVQKEIADANRVSNDKYRMQQLHMQQNKGQIVNAADGKSYIYYPNLNKYEPMLDQNGQHVSKVGTVDKRKESERLQKMESILQQAEGLIGKSTSSGFGNMIDEGASFFGKSNEGADSLAALKSLQGSLVMMMPRMEGPQSDKDVQLYREMAGRLGEPIPASQRMEAIKVIRDLNAKYAEIQGVNSGVAPKGVPYASAGQATTSYNGANVSLSEVKQAAKQAGISTERMVSILKGQGVSIK